MITVEDLRMLLERISSEPVYTISVYSSFNEKTKLNELLKNCQPGLQDIQEEKEEENEGVEEIPKEEDFECSLDKKISCLTNNTSTNNNFNNYNIYNNINSSTKKLLLCA